jgi:hypothetical protein
LARDCALDCAARWQPRREEANRERRNDTATLVGDAPLQVQKHE